MTVHYHGTPITPRRVLSGLAGRNFCVSFAAPQDVEVCHRIGQSVMLDNGAFTAWKQGRKPDWWSYYAWCHKWCAYATTWAVIPDVIDGTEEENDALLREWPHGHKQAAPVWHLNESLTRLGWLCGRWWRVCFGSSGEYATVGSEKWHERVSAAFDRIAVDGRLNNSIHMLRGMSMSGSAYPFASVDSTDIARNHHLPHKDAQKMAARWDSKQCPGTWHGGTRQLEMFNARS